MKFSATSIDPAISSSSNIDLQLVGVVNLAYARENCKQAVTVSLLLVLIDGDF